MIELRIKWIIAIVATIVWIIWCGAATKGNGGNYIDLSALGAIIPTGCYLIFWIIWLIIF